MRGWLTGVVLGGCIASASGGQILLDEPPAELDGVGVEERLGERVPGDIALYDAEGRSVLMGDYFAASRDDKRPVVLMMVYYDCPLLCGLVMEKAHEAWNRLSYQVGEDFKVVVVSFDHTNTPAMAKGQQSSYATRYVHSAEIRSDAEKREAFDASFNFHTTTAGEARRLADSIGFNYNFIPGVGGRAGEYSHPAVLTVLMPDGTISRYLEALDLEPKQLRIGLLEASNGAIGESLGDIFLHSCFTWDPEAGVYSLEAMRAMQIAAGLTTAGLGVFVAVLFVGDSLKKRRLAAAAAPQAGTGEKERSEAAGDAPPAAPAHA